MPFKFLLFDGSDDDEPQDTGVRSDNPTDQNARSWWQQPDNDNESDNQDRPSMWSRLFGCNDNDDNN